MAGDAVAALESRISQPGKDKEESESKPETPVVPEGNAKDPAKPTTVSTIASSSSTSSSWADEVSSPSGTEAPANPSKLTQPSQPSQPAQPAQPSQPSQPSQSSEPSQKSDPANPTMNQTDGASDALGGSPGIIEPDYEVNVTLADSQADPKNPLYSIKSFDQLGLDEAVLKGIYHMRFLKPSKIQENALPLLMRNPPMNFIGQSQSGTGKTAAFVLNILSRVVIRDPTMSKVPQALVLAPTRELARQIIGVIQLMGSFIEGLQVLPAIPMDAANRGKLLEGQIVVGTPGTTSDLIRKRLLAADRIKVLVLDEADNMLDLQGLGDQCIRVKKYVQSRSFKRTDSDLT